MKNSIDLQQGDCLELMKDIPDESVDLILCDPPYQISNSHWDKALNINELWKQYKRIITDKGVICLFGVEPFSSKIRNSNLRMYKYDWYWNKKRGANFLNSHYQPFKIIENIMVFSKSASSYSKKGSMNYFPILEKGKPYISKNGNDNHKVNEVAILHSKIKKVAVENKGTRLPNNVLNFEKDKDKLHPTQKPVALLEYLIKTYTTENMTVLDNCMGSGSTGTACVNTERNFIGMELDKKYFEIAKERINKTKERKAK